jgi:hypothetical protein
MSSSNAWAEFAAVDAQQAIGHGIRARRSKSGAISLDLLGVEASDAAVQ